MEKPGYHINHIPKGVVGTSSKILEEVLELQDAEKQKCKIMALVELSDIVGSIKMYLKYNHPQISLHDLDKMSSITERAFTNGHRLGNVNVPNRVVSKPIGTASFSIFSRITDFMKAVYQELPGEEDEYVVKRDHNTIVFDFTPLTGTDYFATVERLIYEYKLQDYFSGL